MYSAIPAVIYKNKYVKVFKKLALCFIVPNSVLCEKIQILNIDYQKILNNKMKLQRHFTRSLLHFVLFVFLILCSPRRSSALIEDALDVFHVVKEVTTGVLKAWDIVQSSPVGSNINFPLMREKQRKVLSRLKEVSRQIQLTEDQNAEQIVWAIQSIDNLIESNFQLLSKRNEITDTMNRITSRFLQMQQYVVHQDKLENSTLLEFAKWTVSPNAYSIHHLMDRLHLTMFGADDYAFKSSPNMLEMLATSYEPNKTAFSVLCNERVTEGVEIKNHMGNSHFEKKESCTLQTICCNPYIYFCIVIKMCIRLEHECVVITLIEKLYIIVCIEFRTFKSHCRMV